MGRIAPSQVIVVGAGGAAPLGAIAVIVDGGERKGLGGKHDRFWPRVVAGHADGLGWADAWRPIWNEYAAHAIGHRFINARPLTRFRGLHPGDEPLRAQTGSGA